MHKQHTRQQTHHKQHKQNKTKPNKKTQNGTTNTTKSISNDIFFGSIFAEATSDANSAGISMTVGVDYIPFEADIDKRSITQSELGDSNDTASTGTN